MWCVSCKKTVQAAHGLSSDGSGDDSVPSPTSADDPTTPYLGYVVVKVPPHLLSMKGFHEVDWPALEARLRIPTGRLAGRLALFGINLRGVNSIAEAQAHSRGSKCRGAMPVL